MCHDYGNLIKSVPLTDIKINRCGNTHTHTHWRDTSHSILIYESNTE